MNPEVHVIQMKVKYGARESAPLPRGSSICVLIWVGTLHYSLPDHFILKGEGVELIRMFKFLLKGQSLRKYIN